MKTVSYLKCTSYLNMLKIEPEITIISKQYEP